MLRDATEQAVTKTGIEEKQATEPSGFHSSCTRRVDEDCFQTRGLLRSSRLFRTPRRKKMPIDYSKWAALDCSDSDEESAPKVQPSQPSVASQHPDPPPRMLRS